jgi:hypothetical protein
VVGLGGSFAWWTVGCGSTDGPGLRIRDIGRATQRTNRMAGDIGPVMCAPAFSCRHRSDAHFVSILEIDLHIRFSERVGGDLGVDSALRAVGVAWA